MEIIPLGYHDYEVPFSRILNVTKETHIVSTKEGVSHTRHAFQNLLDDKIISKDCFTFGQKW